MEDYEILCAENKDAHNRIKEAIKELDFAIKFAENNGVITKSILEGIKSRLLNQGELK
jgi:hypothetical protein